MRSSRKVSSRRRIVRRPRRGGCSFCKAKKEPDYKLFEELRRFVTDRGKIIGRGRSGLCQKHQRRVAVAIKRARHLALLPFTVQVKV